MAPASASAEDPSTASSTESATTYTRLHVTPFDPSLLNLVIPASIIPRARNVSYHTIETFPEKRFGFVDLPTMDAEKLKKKLNGAVLKGAKMRVETARPESIAEPAADTDATKTTKKEKKEKKKSKKRKHESDVIEGVQLEGRKVKRGWTTTEQEMIDAKRKKAKKDKKDKKDQSGPDDKKDKKDKKKKKATVKSKYTDEPECLFKTKLPGTGPTEEAEDSASTRKNKRKRKSDREVIVHEFEKTTKYPSFLKSNSTEVSAEATTFEDGVGWVDSSGKLVEPVKAKRRAQAMPAPDPPRPKRAAPVSEEDTDDNDDDDDTSSSGTSSDEDDDASSSVSGSGISNKQTSVPVTPKQLRVETPVSSGGSVMRKPESARPKSAGSTTSLSIKIPPVAPPAKEVHPLEALYKRPQRDDGAAHADSGARPFSFFGNEDDLEEDDSLAPASQVPMTPFTKREFEFRNIRSAAPTPDTAHPSRSFHFWPSQHPASDSELGREGDDDGTPEDLDEEPKDEDVNMEDGAVGAETSQAPTSDFQKQFWESRGDLNRAWRKRRKSAAKEKRYRDNRARAERAI